MPEVTVASSAHLRCAIRSVVGKGSRKSATALAPALSDTYPSAPSRKAYLKARAFVGNYDGSEHAQALRSNLCKRLSAKVSASTLRTGLDALQLTLNTPVPNISTAIGMVVNEWNSTSAKSMFSRLIQAAAVAEFGLDSAHLSAIGFSGPFHNTDVKPGQDALRFICSILRAMYDCTQATLKSAGITEVSLYRGMSWMDPSKNVALAYARARQEGHTSLTLPMHPLSSWSADLTTARDWAPLSSKFDLDCALVLNATFPTEFILSTGRSGMGTLCEYEYVVIDFSSADAPARYQAALPVR